MSKENNTNSITIPEDANKATRDFFKMNNPPAVKLERLKNPEDLMEKVEGVIAMSFGLTLDSSDRRKMLKKEGLSAEKLKARMKEYEHDVKMEIDLSGITWGELLEYVAKAMIIEARAPWYKTTDSFESVEEADSAISTLLKEGPYRTTYKSLNSTPFYTPGKRGRKADPARS